MANALLYDSTLCVGCKACETACAGRWKLPYNEKIAEEQTLSDHKLTVVQTHGESFARRMCMHCAEPTCASVCPVGAFTKTALGPVVYDASKCIGCRYCMFACPFQAPVYEWGSTAPKVRKCDQCYDRQMAGKVTACTEACPTGATLSGDRDAMIAEARKRIAENPAGYYPRIYGIQEAGGTGMLLLSKVPFEQLGMPKNLPDRPLPPLTWNVLSFVPDIASVGSVLLGGVYWLTHRREAVAQAEDRPQGGVS